eukprot:m.21051 g.21051  ORF g.21051 m.21051 type:complete len:258 (+) comp8675_c0_seq1:311-1084(+)
MENPPPYSETVPTAPMLEQNDLNTMQMQMQQPPMVIQQQPMQMGRTLDNLRSVPGFHEDDPISEVVPEDEKVLYIAHVTDPEEMGKISCWTTVLPWLVYPPCVVAIVACSPCLWCTRTTHIRRQKSIVAILTNKAIYYHEKQFEVHPCFPVTNRAKTKRIALEEVNDVVIRNTAPSRRKCCCGGCFLSIPLIHIKTNSHEKEVKMRGVEDGHEFTAAINVAANQLAFNSNSNNISMPYTANSGNNNMNMINNNKSAY